MRNAMMLIALLFAVEASALWLLPVSDASFPAGQADAGPAPVDGVGYRPPPGWMHRAALPHEGVASFHVLTNAGVAPSLARWTPLP